MNVFRISRAKYAYQILSGEGGLKVASRWNYKGERIVYTSATRALALLEMLVHLDMEDMKSMDLMLCEIHIPDSLQVQIIKPSQLPEGWKINDRGPAIFLTVIKSKSAGAKPLLRTGKATFQNGVYEFDTEIPGDATKLQFSLRYFYCQEGGEGICKVGEATWTNETNMRDSGQQKIELPLKIKQP